MGIVKALLIFPVTALHLAIVPGGIRANELVTDTKPGGGKLKTSGDLPFAVGKAVSEFKAVIRLDTLDRYAPAFIPLDQPFQEVRGGIGALLRVSGKEAQP